MSESKNIQSESRRIHAILEYVAIMASKARVKKLVLPHSPSVKENEQATRDRYTLFYNGELIFVRDLFKIIPEVKYKYVDCTPC